MIALVLSVAALPATSAYAMGPACQASVGETVPLSAASLSVEDVGGCYHTSSGWPAPGEQRVGALRYAWGLMLQSDDARFGHVDQVQRGVRSSTSGCWLGGDFVWGQDGIVTGIDKPRIVADPYRPGYVRPQPDRRGIPVIAGSRYVAASQSFSAFYPWIGLWAVDGDAHRTGIIAFNNHAHLVLATLPYPLATITTLPSPDSPWTSITVTGASLREPTPFLQFMWRTDIQETNP